MANIVFFPFNPPTQNSLNTYRTLQVINTRPQVAVKADQRSDFYISDCVYKYYTNGANCYFMTILSVQVSTLREW